MKPIWKISLHLIIEKPLRTFFSLLSVILSIAMVVLVCCFSSTMLNYLLGNGYYEAYEAASIKGIFVTFVVITAILGACMIYSAFSIQFDRRTNLLGTLTALGASHRQKGLIILIETLIYAICGASIGFFLGIWLAKASITPLGSLLAAYFETEPIGLYLNLSWLLGGTALGFAVTVIAAFIPMLRVIRTSVIASIHTGEKINISLRKGVVSDYTERLFGRLGKLAGQNYENYKIKYRAISLALSGCTIFYIAISCFILYATQAPPGHESAFIEIELLGNQLVSALRLFTVELVLISLFSAFGNAVVTMNRRKKDFALLKSLGMSNNDLYKMMGIESIYIGLYSAIYGLIGALSLDIAVYIYAKMTTPYLYFEFPIIGYFAFVGLDLVVAFLFALYSVIRIRKVNLVDAMR